MEVDLDAPLWTTELSDVASEGTDQDLAEFDIPPLTDGQEETKEQKKERKKMEKKKAEALEKKKQKHTPQPTRKEHH